MTASSSSFFLRHVFVFASYVQVFCPHVCLCTMSLQCLSKPEKNTKLTEQKRHVTKLLFTTQPSVQLMSIISQQAIYVYIVFVW